jgi:hypothetical protein
LGEWAPGNGKKQIPPLRCGMTTKKTATAKQATAKTGNG